MSCGKCFDGVDLGRERETDRERERGREREGERPKAANSRWSYVS